MFASGQVLCVEDDKPTREMLVELLKRSGLAVRTASNPVAALHAIKTGWFDLYMLDSYLPDIDGFELCQRIREFDQRTPILFYSGAARECDRQTAMAAGADAYVIKPRIRQLLETSAELLKRRHSLRYPTPVVRTERLLTRPTSSRQSRRLPAPL